MDILAGLLCAPGTRLVTLTGPGGAGKTRLSIEAARRMADHFAGGVWFVPLGDLREAGRVPGAIAEALCLPRSPDAAPLAQVAERLNTPNGGGAPRLLVLDNFEHLVEQGAPIVHTLLARVPHLTCLITSRQRLLWTASRSLPCRRSPRRKRNPGTARPKICWLLPAWPCSSAVPKRPAPISR
jgi:predicted ATPase